MCKEPIPQIGTSVGYGVQAFAWLGIGCLYAEEIALVNLTALSVGLAVAAPFALMAVVTAAVYALSCHEIIPSTYADFIIAGAIAVIITAFVIASLALGLFALEIVITIALIGAFYTGIHIVLGWLQSEIHSIQKELNSLKREHLRLKDQEVKSEDEAQAERQILIEKLNHLEQEAEAGLKQVQKLTTTGEVVEDTPKVEEIQRLLRDIRELRAEAFKH